MKLEQGQLWKKGEIYYRIVKWSRTAIDYKIIDSSGAEDNTRHEVTKKEFCRLIKEATLISKEDFLEETAPDDLDEAEEAL